MEKAIIASQLAVNHPVLFNLLCWSMHCSAKVEWFDSYETGVDATNKLFLNVLATKLTNCQLA